MKRALPALAVLVLLGAAVAVAMNGAQRGEPGASATGVSRRNAPVADAPGSPIQIEKQDRNPWTNLKVNNKPRNFQFAIVTDRTGGRRPGVFTRAVEKVNLLQPEFVMSVGDLIEGYNEDPGMWALEWSEFEAKLQGLQMPFFFCPGNHDITNVPMSDEWHRRFGRSYYHFKYHDVLFVVLNSEDKTSPLKKPPYYIGEKQRKWADGVLKANRDVRWTFVILHKPWWYYLGADHRLLGWKAIEESLGERQYTVFAGHNHRYGRYIRNGREHYILATTGGASQLQKGMAEGYFDHFVWVTMKGNRPVIANLLLSGIHDRRIRDNPPIPRPAKRPRRKRK